MAITHDADAVSTDQTTSPITWNHTVGVGTNNYLCVGVALNADVTAPTATAVTYGGVTMTKVTSVTEDGTTDHMEVSVWFLKNPTGGTNQVSVTFTGGTSPHGAGGSSSYFGVSQRVSASYGNAGGGNGTTSGPHGFAFGAKESNAWYYAVGINTATTSPTLTASATQRSTQTLANTQPGVMVTQDPNTTGTTSFTFTMGGTGLGGYAVAGFPFYPDRIEGQALVADSPYIVVGNGMSRNERAT